ncbi:undecaprenyl diphosphate synthase family protein [Actinacidiphila sp. SB3-2]
MDAVAATAQWHIRPIGALDLLPADHRAQLHALTRRPTPEAGGILNVAIGYDGRADILAAVQELLHEPDVAVADDGVEARLERCLSTAGQPDIDLVIRTSGEQRLSGFMPWQTAYAEIYFTPVLWPDFAADDFTAALDFYRTRQRRWGT